LIRALSVFSVYIHLVFFQKQKIVPRRMQEESMKAKEGL
jgi:hypothetical protein